MLDTSAKATVTLREKFKPEMGNTGKNGFPDKNASAQEKDTGNPTENHNENVMKYQTPTHLSDPGGDFSPEELNRILSKADAELDWADFDCLFFGKMPAGTYEEVRYYIPLACAYLENQRDACNFFEHFSIWITTHD